MYKILFVAFSLVYICNIFVNLFHLFQIFKGIRRLNNFIYCYEQRKDCKHKQSKLLRYFPIISRYLGCYSKTLTYNDSVYRIYEKCVPMRNALLSQRDNQIHYLMGEFIPISALKIFLSIPYQLLLWCGFRPNRNHKSAINTIGIAVEVLLAKILESHYAELESFIKSVPDIIRDIWNSIL